MSTKSVPLILTLKGKYTLRFPKFLIISIYSSGANCWFGIIYFLIALPENILLKKL